MNLWSVCGWLAAVFAGLTSLNMLIDAPVRLPAGSSWTKWIHHYTRVVTLLGITAAAFLVGTWPLFGHALSASRFEVLLRCALTGFLMSHAPCPWWRYVTGWDRRKQPDVRIPFDRRAPPEWRT
jgi:hypothetical protein